MRYEDLLPILDDWGDRPMPVEFGMEIRRSDYDNVVYLGDPHGGYLFQWRPGFIAYDFAYLPGQKVISLRRAYWLANKYGEHEIKAATPAGWFYVNGVKHRLRYSMYFRTIATSTRPRLPV